MRHPSKIAYFEKKPDATTNIIHVSGTRACCSLCHLQTGVKTRVLQLPLLEDRPVRRSLIRAPLEKDRRGGSLLLPLSPSPGRRACSLVVHNVPRQPYCCTLVVSVHAIADVRYAALRPWHAVSQTRKRPVGFVARRKAGRS